MKTKSQESIDPLLGLYVHWPYCAKICPYCDFNVRRDRGRDTEFLVDAIVADIASWAVKMDQPRALISLSFGGGTPSRLLPQQIEKIIEAAEHAFGFEEQVEISLEANPGDHKNNRFQDFAMVGINRLSLGVQSLSSTELKFLGRDHSADDALAALDAALTSFNSVSADFIYGLPKQSLQQWQQSLQEILSLNLPHLSLYCLSIEPGTGFAKYQQQGKLTPLDDDLVADLYQCTQAMTKTAGLPAYETSNHAKDVSSRSIHNLLYWQGDDWIGVGPGAHGRLAINGKRQELASHRRPQNYAKAVTETGWGVEQETALNPQDDLAERVLLGLRLKNGIELKTLQHRAGVSLNAQALNGLINSKLLQLDQGYLIATKPLLVDRIARELLL